MRHPIPLAIALSAALAAAPALGRAQDTVRTESKGEVATRPSFSSLVSAIDATVLTTDQIKKLDADDLKDVRIVQTSTIVTPTDQKAFDDALQRNKSYVDALRTAVRAQDALTQALSTNTPAFTVDDVVAAEIGPEKQVTLFVRHM